MATKAEVEKFQKDGFLIIENFVDDVTVEEMRTECAQLVNDMNPAEHHTIFSTEKQEFRDNYFINSADKIGYFFEDGALDEKGQLQVSKDRSLNKIAHAMHVFCPSFRKVTFCDKIKTISRDIGLVDPVVMQSMYIFKQPKIGGAVVPHQDGSFLHTDPMKGLIGYWIALEDATLDNGCLWFIPGSHKDGVYGGFRMVRNPEKDGPSCTFIGDKPEYDDSKYVSGPVKKGSLVLIDGLVVHKSLPNTSENSRHIYTFHVYDKGTSTWSDRNWLQPTSANTFTHMYDVKL